MFDKWLEAQYKTLVAHLSIHIVGMDMSADLKGKKQKLLVVLSTGNPMKNSGYNVVVVVCRYDH